MLNIKVIIGSTRPNRFGQQPANWIMELAKQYPTAHFELVDLEKLNLPLLDEPIPPLEQQYSKDHSKEWAAMVEATDGFIFVTPEYNHSVSASLKNAIDFAAKEWYFKPVSFISYGADAGGSRAIEHLRQITGYLNMYDLGEYIIMPWYWSGLSQDGKFQPTERQTEAGQKLLTQLVFWSEKMKAARADLPASSAT